MVGPDNSKHGQNKFGSDGVKHYHGILALFHLSLIKRITIIKTGTNPMPISMATCSPIIRTTL